MSVIAPLVIVADLGPLVASRFAIDPAAASCGLYAALLACRTLYRLGLESYLLPIYGIKAELKNRINTKKRLELLNNDGLEEELETPSMTTSPETKEEPQYENLFLSEVNNEIEKLPEDEWSRYGLLLAVVLKKYKNKIANVQENFLIGLGAPKDYLDSYVDSFTDDIECGYGDGAAVRKIN